MDPSLTGKIISEKRKEKGLNQIQLGEILSVSNRTISKWENGDGYPDITLLPDIAKCLDISIDELLTGERLISPQPEQSKEDSESESSDKSSNDFMLCFIASLFLAVFGALLGGVTELYSIWAFPILFYTHWEIMFVAVSLFAVVTGVFIFALGVFRLSAHHTKDEIITAVHNKAMLLTVLLAVFPLTFIARIVSVSKYGYYTTPITLAIAILFAALVIVIRRRIINENTNKNEKDKNNT